MYMSNCRFTFVKFMHSHGRTYLLPLKASFKETFFTTFQGKISKKFFTIFHKVKPRSGTKDFSFPILERFTSL